MLTPIWGHASLPRLLSIGYAVPRVLVFPTQNISSRANQLKVFPSTSSKSADCVPPYGRTDFFPINITASEVLPPNNRFFYFLGAPNLAHLTGQKNPCPHMGYACHSPSWLYTASTVPRVRGFPTYSIPSRPNQLRVFPRTRTKSAEST